MADKPAYFCSLVKALLFTLCVNPEECRDTKQRLSRLHRFTDCIGTSPELEIRGSTEDDSEIIFLISAGKHML